ncbi:MAG: FAD-binding oxidoreductase, partial [Sediminibacterium sp.]|nr:FAD-binding oxidoreductase [Sediminibacterium sp.]
CRTLVHATGYETVETIGRKIVTLGSTYAVSSEQAGVKPGLARKGVLLWSTARPYLYVRTTADNRIIAGGRDESFSMAAKRDALIAGKSRQLVKDFRKLVPGTEFNPEFSWAGTFGSTPDGLPVIGRYHQLPRSLFALGFGGNGITFSVLAAEMITGIIQGAANADLSLFSFDRL